MQFSKELKELIEQHPEIIDFIKQRNIETLYNKFKVGEYFTVSNFNTYSKCIGELYYLLTSLDINPLEYLTTMPPYIIQNADINRLVIPSNITSFKSNYSIIDSKIDTLVIESDKILFDYGLWIYNTQVNNFVCNSTYIKCDWSGAGFEDILYILAKSARMASNNSVFSVKFTFKKNAKAYEYYYGYRSIRNNIKNNYLDEHYDITLV